MQTTIVNPVPIYKQRKLDKITIENLEDRVSSLLTENMELECTIRELEDKIEAYENDYEIETPLGNIFLRVDTDNVKIQEELDAFANALKQKYL